MKKKQQNRGSLLNVLLGLLFYAFIHEMGHAVAVWYLGGKVTKFNLVLLYSHISYIGVEDNGLISLGGYILSAFVMVVFLFFYRSKPKTNRIIKILGCFSVLVLTSAIFWIVVLLSRIFNLIPMGDDVSTFLEITRSNEVYTLIFISLLFFTLFAFFIRKKIFDLVMTTRNAPGKYFLMIIVLSGLGYGLIFWSSKDQIYDSLNISVKVKDNIADPQTKSIPITVKEKGEYEILGDWNPDNLDTSKYSDNTGILTGFTLLDAKNQVVFSKVGESVTNMTSQTLNMEKGQYSLVLSFLSSEESWDSYASLIGDEESDSNYAFAKKANWNIHITYRITK